MLFLHLFYSFVGVRHEINEEKYSGDTNRETIVVSSTIFPVNVTNVKFIFQTY